MYIPNFVFRLLTHAGSAAFNAASEKKARDAAERSRVEVAQQAAYAASPEGRCHAAEEEAARLRSEATARIGAALPELQARKEFLRERAQRVCDGLQEQCDAGAIDDSELATRAKSVDRKLQADLQEVESRAVPIRQALDGAFATIDSNLAERVEQIKLGLATGTPEPSSITEERRLGCVTWANGRGRADCYWDGTSLCTASGHPVDWRLLSWDKPGVQFEWANGDTESWYKRELQPYLEGLCDETEAREIAKAYARNSDSEISMLWLGLLVMFLLGLPLALVFAQTGPSQVVGWVLWLAVLWMLYRGLQKARQRVDDELGVD